MHVKHLNMLSSPAMLAAVLAVALVLAAPAVCFASVTSTCHASMTSPDLVTACEDAYSLSSEETGDAVCRHQTPTRQDVHLAWQSALTAADTPPVLSSEPRAGAPKRSSGDLPLALASNDLLTNTRLRI